MAKISNKEKSLHLLIFLILTINLLGSNLQAMESEEKPPNIIFILADDMGYGDVEAYNRNSKIPTPHLNKLAKGGMVFTDAHTSSSVCTPTRYALLTGRYNWRSRLQASVTWGFSKRLIEDGRSTVANILQSAGYHTSCIGKWRNTTNVEFPCAMLSTRVAARIPQASKRPKRCGVPMIKTRPCVRCVGEKTMRLLV